MGFSKRWKSKPDLAARVVYPSAAIFTQLKSILASYPDLQAKVEFVPNTQKALPASAVLMSSGTMSLAVAMSAIPGAIAYRLNTLSYWLGKLLVKVPYIGISNLLLKRGLHPEFIQGAASTKQLAAEIVRATEPAAAVEAADGAKELGELLSDATAAAAGTWDARVVARLPLQSMVGAMTGRFCVNPSHRCPDDLLGWKADYRSALDGVAERPELACSRISAVSSMLMQASVMLWP